MSELVDLVDEHGAVVQTGVERDDAQIYPNGFMRIVIGVITNSAGEVLVHERASSKTVARNCIDLVCGGIHSGETPEDAFLREASEEVGVTPTSVRRVAEGVNEYGRYRVLFHGESDAAPSEPDFEEVNWAGWRSVEELRAESAAGTMKFVSGFFEDIDHVLAV